MMKIIRLLYKFKYRFIMSAIDVLWLEDDPKEDFVKLAKNKKFNIKLIHCGTADKALIYIDKYINQLDGAILDARGHCVQGDEESEKGMYEVIRKLTSFSRERPIPVAVITGQEDLLKKDGFEVSVLYKLFRKNRDEMDLLKYIREGAEKLEDVKIKNEHPLVFEIFDEEIVKQVVKESKIQSLKSRLISQLKDTIDISSNPGIIRDFFEGLIFPLFEHYGVIPKYCKEYNDKARALNF